jgi:PhzF family phenazine biosynthesis protein
MSTYRFKQVDVFSDRHFRGNPVAVVLDAAGISDDEMQRIAAWTNLSETTFMLRPTTDEADYLLRIFTPTSELPFAGHPTIGSAHAALEEGAVAADDGRLRQECGIGIIDLTIEEPGDGENGLISFEASPKIGQSFESAAEAISAALGAEVSLEPVPMSVDVGAVWVVCYIEDSDAVAKLRPDMAAVARLSEEFDLPGICVFAIGGEDGATIRVRCFAPYFGVPEDPVTGSAAACVGRYLAETGLIEKTGREYSSSQGDEMGREGRLRIRVSDDGTSVQVGGRAVTTVEGTISV